MNSRAERGAVNPLVIASILLGLLAAGFAGAFIWAFMGYQDYKSSSDEKVAAAVKVAKKDQQTADEKDFEQRYKEPNKVFNGPTDLGNVKFSYPKTWSVMVNKSGANGDNYEAYLHLDVVPLVSDTQAFATRASILDKSYDSVVKSYDTLVKKGDLKSSPIKTGDFTGIRLDGTFSKTRTGSAVIFKIRDKTLVVACDSPTFLPDFENIVKTLDFNP